MAGIVDLGHYRQARQRGVRPGIAAEASLIEAGISLANLVHAEPMTNAELAALSDELAPLFAEEAGVITSEEVDLGSNPFGVAALARVTTLENGDVSIAIETDTGRVINQVAGWPDDDALGELIEALQDARRLRAALATGTAS